MNTRMKKACYHRRHWPAAVRRELRQAIYDFHVRAFGEEMARLNFQPLAKQRRNVGQMVDHALPNGVKFEKPALGLTP